MHDKTINHYYAGIFLVTKSGRVIGQRRDNKPTIDNPNKIGTFGGKIEEGEDPLSAVWRELTLEETNLKIDKSDIMHLHDDTAWRELTKEWEQRYFFYVIIDNQTLDTLEVYEGQGWAYIDNPEDQDLIELWRTPTGILFSKLELGRF